MSLILNIKNKEIVEIHILCQYPRVFVQISSLSLLFSVAVFNFLLYLFNKKIIAKQKKNQFSQLPMFMEFCWGPNMVLNALGNFDEAKSQVLRKNLLSRGEWG